MSADKYRFITGDDDYNLVNRAVARIGAEWPEFMLHDPVADLLADCYEKLPEYQFVLVETGKSDPLAIANSIPLAWQDDMDSLPDDGWDWALTKGIEDYRLGRTPHVLCALQIVVFGENRGKGLSAEAVRAMLAIGQSHRLQGMIAPVRPSVKCDYPLTPIDGYIKWTTDSGLPFDPWLRVHHRLGARIVKACPTAMRITGTVAEWESWTGLRFLQSGKYIVPGALVPVEIDCEKDLGIYTEPNVWMHHSAQ